MHINQFPKDVQDYVHELVAKVIKRAIENGTYNNGDSPETKEKEEQKAAL